MGRTSKKVMEVEGKEKVIIEQFRTAVADILTPEKDNDKYLRKWLFARKFNLVEAEKMLRKHVQFMRLNELDKITPDFVSHEAGDYFHTAAIGFDKEGSVVRLIRLGSCDLKGGTQAMPKADALKHAYYLLVSDYHWLKTERMDKGLAACEKQVYIMDMQGLAWRSIIHRAVVERSILLLRTYEANHPENLKTAYIVNAPSFFSFVYNWLKTILPETIVSKIQILSSDECGAVLTKIMDPSVLPAFIGGQRRDPDGDPTCPSMFKVRPGTPIPERLLAHDQHGALLQDPDAKRKVVESRGVFRVEVAVDVPQSILHWDFQTLQNDIRMGLNFRERDGSPSKTILPVHRVDSHRTPESGRYDCQDRGIYEIVFDNTYSWMTKKELVYKVEVILPNN